VVISEKEGKPTKKKTFEVGEVPLKPYNVGGEKRAISGSIRLQGKGKTFMEKDRGQTTGKTKSLTSETNIKKAKNQLD